MTLGYIMAFGPFGSLVAALGGRASVNFLAEELEPFYGTRTPVGFTVFLNLRSPMMEGGMGGCRCAREPVKVGKFVRPESRIGGVSFPLNDFATSSR